jgi:hypothetical protein
LNYHFTAMQKLLGMLNEVAKRVWLQSVSEEQSGECKSGESAQTDFALHAQTKRPAKRQMHLQLLC